MLTKSVSHPAAISPNVLFRKSAIEIIGASKWAWPNGDESAMFRTPSPWSSPGQTWTSPSPAGQARRQQVPGEDPLDGILGAYVEGHADRVGIGGAVAEAGDQRNGPVLGNHKAEPELS